MDTPALSPAQLPAVRFVVKCRSCDSSIYTDRCISREWEDDYTPLFKIVSPVAGSFIVLEARYIIDAVVYERGKIVLLTTLHLAFSDWCR